MKRLPRGCLSGCLSAQKVAYFPCAESHRDFRQHSMKALVNIGVAWLPPLAMLQPLGNPVLPGCCREGCL